MINLSIRKKNELTKKKKKGFTLIELIIVIAIIAILAAIAIPRFGAIRENGNVRADLATAKNIQTAVSTAVANNDISLPTVNHTLTAAELSNALNSGVPVAKERNHRGNAFSAVIEPDGTIQVLVGTDQIFPTATAGTAYATALSAS